MNQGYDKTVDWWAIGILIYELIFGRTPFGDKKRYKMFENIKTKPLIFPNKRLKSTPEYSTEVEDLISKLLDRNVESRLGRQNGA